MIHKPLIDKALLLIEAFTKASKNTEDIVWTKNDDPNLFQFSKAYYQRMVWHEISSELPDEGMLALIVRSDKAGCALARRYGHQFRRDINTQNGRYISLDDTCMWAYIKDIIPGFK